MVWIVMNEDANSIARALKAWAKNIPCSRIGCEHPVTSHWSTGSDGQRIFSTERACAPPHAPVVCHDKHPASFCAVLQAGCAFSLLDPWHGQCAWNKQMKDVIKVDPASRIVLDQAFRLWTRSNSVKQAAEMRDELVALVLNECQVRVAPMWSVSQAQKIIHYHGRYWHFDERVLLAWIDLRRLQLRFEVGEKGIAGTNPNEGTHGLWDKHMMAGFVNRSVLNVTMKITGINADGTMGHGYFRDAENRHKHGGNKGPNVSDAISDVRACKKFLECLPKFGATSLHLSECVKITSNGVVFVKPFGQDERILRHAEVELNNKDCLSFPHCLDNMRAKLAHGGTESFVDDDGIVWHTVDPANGKCRCKQSISYGVVGSRGSCKHDRLRCLVEDALVTHEAFENVYGRASKIVVKFIYDRERSKNSAIRCKELYEASKGGHVLDVLDALKQHKSVPPTGRSTGIDDATARQIAAAGGNCAGTDVLSCTFPRGADVGLVFTVHESGGLEVLAHDTCKNGDAGPARYSGDRITCGDVVTSVNGLACLDNCLDKNGLLALHPEFISSPLILHFQHSVLAGTGETDKGGCFGEKKFKFSKHRGVLEGGAQKRKESKTRHTHSLEKVKDDNLILARLREEFLSEPGKAATEASVKEAILADKAEFLP
jgi:hypothetical protein